MTKHSTFFALLFGITLLFLSCEALASHSIDFTITSSADSSGWETSYDGSQEGANGYNWGVEVGQTVTTASATITDRTTDLGASLGFSGWNPWKIGGSIAFSTTPDESIYSLGPRAYLKFKWILGTSEKQDSPKVGEINSGEEANDEFKPFLTFQFSGGARVYTSELSSAQGRRNGSGAINTAMSSLSIVQNTYELSLGAGVFSWMNVQGGYTWYAYNRDIGTFLSRLDSNLFLKANAQGLSETTSGLSNQSAYLVFTFDLSEDLSLDAEFMYFRNASDNLITRGAKLALDYDLSDHWGINASGERLLSDSGYVSVGTLGLSYTF